MDKFQTLEDIFANDQFDILNVKPKVSTIRNADERLSASFSEVNDFFVQYNREPQPNPANISEFQLYSRLKSIRSDIEKMESLEEQDIHGLLKLEPKEINSIDDIFNDDSFDLLEDDTDLFDFKHTPKTEERMATDFVAKRKPVKDFDKYESLFKEIQSDLATGKRKLVDFKMGNLREETYYVHNGVLFLLEEINIDRKDHYKKDGTRVREDGRTKCIFENGTHSNMLKRSVEKILYANGKVVSENIEKVNESFIEKFSAITEEDEAAGYIYVLRSKSRDDRITEIDNLYKIGYSKVEVEERIKNAEKDPTYLMAQVKIITSWKCYNMNPQKLEQLLHNFFGKSCLNVDIFDEKKRRHTPREWFIAPIDVIEQAIELIISGEVVKYSYDEVSCIISKK
ncbi:GIY-YIG nuclease family protein [Flavobacterium degerlachei]|uniref:T5orf172 domain-containing protein n=1 Tax=Flavobacterium degerlachei TaxID=229203 RepID=A0A1H3E6H0_9FLAO|nr:GIY-YIG nuclease family protein [Flavobacterium degerlachei]SDX74245.1 T5orf172 domain-containing protein [Flavobacterium degerlachei]